MAEHEAHQTPPELIGAEHILAARAVNDQVARRLIEIITGFEAAIRWPASSRQAARAASICAGIAPAGVSSRVVKRQRSHIAQRHGHSRPVRNTVPTRATVPRSVSSSSMARD